MIGKIVYLTPDDDIAGIRDRVEWANADRVALVFPEQKGAHPMREVDFQLIRRMSEQSGCQIAVVSSSGTTRATAQQCGLVTFRTVQQAIMRGWSDTGEIEPITRLHPQRHFRPSSLRRFFPRRNYLAIGLRLVISMVALAVVAASALVIVPSATLTLRANSESISLIVPVTLDRQIDRVDLQTSTVPVQRVDVIVEDVATVATTGAKDIARGKSRGSVILLNVLSTPFNVPKNTVVRTSSASVAVRFITMSGVEVPPGGQAETPIEALEEGPSGNVPANQINVVEGMPALAVKVFNLQGTRGGGVETVRAVTEDDYARARAAVREKLLRIALDRMKEDTEVVRNGLYVIANTLFIADVQDETYDRFITERADEVTLNMRLQVAGNAVNPAHLDAVAAAVLEDNVSSDFSLLSVRHELGDVAEEGTGTRQVFYIIAHGIAGAEISEGQVKRQVRGLTISEAQSVLLRELSLRGNPVIKVEPDWLFQRVSRLPFVTLRIGVNVVRE